MTSFRDSIRDSNGGAYLLYFLGFLYFMVVSAVLFEPLGFHLATIVSEFVGILGAALLWRWLAGDAAASWPSFRLGVGPGAVVALVVASVALGFWANATAALVVELSPTLKEVAEAYSQRIAELLIEATGRERVLGILGVCVAAPLCEEALFRGTILQEQRKTERIGLAVVINGVLFSAFHVNPVSAVGLALLGVFLAHLTVASGSLWPAIIAHAVVNTTNAVILPEFAPEAAGTDVPVEMSELLMLIGLLSVVAAFFWWLSLRLIKRGGQDHAGD